MQLRYGNFFFETNAAGLSYHSELLWNQGGQPYAQRRAFSCQGYLTTLVAGPPAAQQADLTARENTMKNALARPGLDLVLLDDAGNPTAEVLLNALSITGVRNTSLDFPRFEGPEYATLRSYTASWEAEYPLVGSANLLVSFSETLTFWGGGPRYAHRESLNGPPQKQLIYPQTVYHVTQQGTAVGYRKYPVIPGPKWPFALREAGRLNQKSPERKGAGYQNYEVSWQYDFESESPLAGVPNIWIS
jgi:hypothetical protein